jgi:hypothetical protein
MITVNIETGKINKEFLVKGKNGKTYLDVVLFETPDSEYGNDYVAVQGVTKEQRNEGKKGPIIGNAKIYQSRKEDARVDKAKEPSPAPDDSEVPF